MRRAGVAVAAAGIVLGATACGGSRTQPPSGGRSPASHPGGMAVVSCRVVVTYLDSANTVAYYLPDTGANFRRHFARNNVSANASLAVVVTFVNHTSGPASLPTGLVVSFTDRSGSHVGLPRTFNKEDGTGYGGAVAHERGSGEVYSATTFFNPGQTVTESPDIGASLPRQPDLNCDVSGQ
jgi:hypothetical protein